MQGVQVGDEFQIRMHARNDGGVPVPQVEFDTEYAKDALEPLGPTTVNAGTVASSIDEVVSFRALSPCRCVIEINAHGATNDPSVRLELSLVPAAGSDFAQHLSVTGGLLLLIGAVHLDRLKKEHIAVESSKADLTFGRLVAGAAGAPRLARDP